jgi:hypothetical protein
MPFEANDFQERYLRSVFAFIGIPDIEIIRAEGLALSPAHREAALNTAHATIPTAVAAARTRHAAERIPRSIPATEIPYVRPYPRTAPPQPSRSLW